MKNVLVTTKHRGVWYAQVDDEKDFTQQTYAAEVQELLRLADPAEVPYITRAAEVDGNGYGDG